MSLRSNDRQWGSVAKFFHWLMALGILGVGIVGLLMTDMAPSMNKINVYALHKSAGLTILALFLLRLLWRLIDRRPPDEPAPRWQHLAAHVTHGVLYVLIAAIPLSGWWFNSVHGYPLQWFKQFNMPALAEKNEAVEHLAGTVHEYLFWLLILVLVAHAGAALKHHVLDKDNVLRRMLPFGKIRDASTTSQGDKP
ncbi:cytochrome b [Dyella tabacisoli]|uniref:Cytochrome b n=1 Tax=Dyella tabacisoli TaxID=2282381 RepID=A0A369UJ45_9GAMM|nr:cytochrome b [Dyella tabacisoli]RDD80537.1 cytochrome b [Dyella tabacisoli]